MDQINGGTKENWSLLSFGLFIRVLLLIFSSCLMLPAFSQLSGSYTVGTSSSDFLSLDSAFRILENKGLNGNVQLLIRAGTYNEQVVYNKVPGTDSGYTILVKKHPSDTGDVKFVKRRTDLSWKYILLIRHGSLAFENLTFEISDSASPGGSVVEFKDTVSHIRFQRCTFYGDRQSQVNYAGNVINAEYDVVLYDFHLLESEIIGGSIGVSLAVGIFSNELGIIRNNKFIDNFIGGIKVQNLHKLWIEGNYVKSVAHPDNYVGINIRERTDSIFVRSNEVYIANDATGIRCDGGDYMEFFNNIIFAADYDVGNGVLGIFINTTRALKFWHNSIILKGKSTVGLLLTRSDTNYVCELYNNNYCLHESGVAIYMRTLVYGSKFKSDYNNFYAGGNNPIQMGAKTVTYSLDSLKVLGLDIHSIEVKTQCYPWLNGRTHNHLLDGKGKPGLDLNIDIDGKSRGINPDIGANEFSPIRMDVGVFDILTDSISRCGSQNEYLTVVLYNYGSEPVDSIDVTLIIKDSKGNSDSLSITYFDSIPSLDTVKIRIGPFSISNDIYTIYGATHLKGDGDSMNNFFLKEYRSTNSSMVHSVNSDTICEGHTAYLTYPNRHDKVYWYSTNTSQKLIDSSTVLSLKGLTQSTWRYFEVEEMAAEYVGLDTPRKTTGYLDTTGWSGLIFEVREPVYIDSVTVFPNGSGTIDIRIVGYKSQIFSTGAISISGDGTIPRRIHLGKWIDVGRYRMVCTVKGLDDLRRDNNTSLFPPFPFYSPNKKLVITSGCYSVFDYKTTSYYFFYNWVIRDKLCRSQRDSTFIFVNPSPKFNLGPDTIICTNGEKKFTLDATANKASYYWSTGENTPTIQVDKNGSYTVNVIDSLKCQKSDVIQVSFLNKPELQIAYDTQICSNRFKEFDIVAIDTFEKYYWNTGDSTHVAKVRSEGKHILVAKDSNGCWLNDTVVVSTLSSPFVDLGKDTSFCIEDSIKFILSGLQGNYRNYWQGSMLAKDYLVDSPQTVIVDVTNTITGCNQPDTMVISRIPYPDPMLGPDIEFCSNDSFSKTLKSSKMTSYHWDDGSSNMDRTILKEGEYFVQVIDSNGCVGVDTIVVIKNIVKQVNLGNDTSYCVNRRFSWLIDFKESFRFYLWENGSKVSYHILDEKGEYWVRTEDENGCFDRDTLIVNALSLPAVSLPDEILLNPNLPVDTVLSVDAGYKSYYWNNGKSTPSIQIKDTGIFWVKVIGENNCYAYDTSIIHFWHPLSVYNLNNLLEVSVYPNPADDLLTVYHPNNSNLNIDLYNIIGKLIKPSITQSSNKSILNLNNIPSGVYTIIICNENQMFTVERIEVLH